MNKIIFQISFIAIALSGFAQSPGGVPANLSLWLKANTTVAANITYNAGFNISNWKSDVGTYQVSQATATKQPVFNNVPLATSNFNFNPSIQFNGANITTLFNSATTPNLLNTNGSLFIVTNRYGTGSGNMLTYYSSSTYRFQVKPNFRAQNGVSPNGYKFDLNTLPGTIINYPEASGFILTCLNTGANSQTRRNATDFGPPSSNIPTYFPAISPGLYLGSNNGTIEACSHALGEVIMYNNLLNAADVAKVESYLAIKYGITFDELASLSTNYVASDGTVVWNKSINTGYNENIAGIARDDASGLMQKQAKSVNSKGLVAVFNGNTNGVFPLMNDNNTATLPVDKSFFLFADNNADTTMNICISNGYMSRMGRVWKVQKTGTVNSVTLAINNNELLYAKKLLVSNNPAFPDNATTIYPLSNNGTYRYSPLVLNNNQYFTFATDSMIDPRFLNVPVCPGLTGTVSITNPVTGAVYKWYATATGGSPLATGLSYTISNLAATTNFYVESTTPYNCIVPNRIQTVAQTANLITVKTNNDTSVCSGKPVFISTISNGINFSWSPATGLSNANIANPIATPAVTTQYVVTATLASCLIKDTLLITVFPDPAADAGPDLVIILGDQIALQGIGSAGNYLWTPNINLTNPAILNPVASPQANTLYKLTVTNSNGCARADSMLLTVLSPCINPVNAFTPNGDGIHDKWVVTIGTGCIIKMEAAVFNRYGSRVYESKDYHNDWDGRYNGKPLPDATYYYVIKYFLINGKVITSKGDVTILR
jgi:gliding motility-associated-like protein